MTPNHTSTRRPVQFAFPSFDFICSFTNATMTNYISRKNSLYGSLQPSVTNVVFTHGTLDPWHRIGILTDLNSQSPCFIISGKFQYQLRLKNSVYEFTITGVSHGRNTGSINVKKDSKEMLHVKTTIRKLVKSWLNL